MKKIIIVLAALVLFGSVAQAEQKDEMTDPKGMAPQDAAMRMICPMMDMMQSMLDMMKMQQKMYLEKQLSCTSTHFVMQQPPLVLKRQ